MDKMFDLDLQLSSSQGDVTPNTIFITNSCGCYTNGCPTNEGCPATPGCFVTTNCSVNSPCVEPYGDDI